MLERVREEVCGMYVFLNESLYVTCVERLPRVRVYCIYVPVLFLVLKKRV